jgi:hypothetical protein
MWLRCCQCGEQFEIVGQLEAKTLAFYAAQPNHTPDKEGGACDACWEKSQAKPPIRSRAVNQPIFRWSILGWLLLACAVITSFDVVSVWFFRQHAVNR